MVKTIKLGGFKEADVNAVKDIIKQADGTAEKKLVKTIDMTPKWVDILPVMLEAYESGSTVAREAMREEFKRMAAAADEWNAHVKGKTGE
ncbi:hypothetical protein [Rhizobium phage RHEph12]|nr:hypothetical protein [Rhizobium phage RHEph12]